MAYVPTAALTEREDLAESRHADTAVGLPSDRPSSLSASAVWSALQTDPPHPIRNLLPPPGMLERGDA